MVKAYARRLGLEAADFSGHSLRAGFLTSAARRRRLDLQDARRVAAQVHGRAA